MNIFVLDLDKAKCARYMVDRHLNKMPSEHSQMLSTAYRVMKFVGYRPHPIKGAEYKFLTDKEGDAQQEMYLNGIRIYKSAYINHPCNVWVRSSLRNFLWLCSLNQYIDRERAYRRFNVPGNSTLVSNELERVIDMPDIGLTRFAEAMPDYCRTPFVVNSYRTYYVNEKLHLHTWKYRSIPHWILREMNTSQQIELLNKHIDYSRRILAEVIEAEVLDEEKFYRIHRSIRNMERKRKSLRTKNRNHKNVMCEFL